jgi:hypothetical protein
MNISRKEREELDLLSKEVFGTTTRWKKLCDSGYEEALTEEKQETMPTDENGVVGETKTIRVPVRATKNGGVKYVTKYHTPATVKEYMLQQKKQFSEIREKIQKYQDDMKKKQAEEAIAKKVNDEAAGSVA